MRELAGLTPQEVWYARLDVDESADRLMQGPLADSLGRATKKARKRTGASAVAKLTEPHEAGLRIRNEPPELERVDEEEWTALRPFVVDLMTDYLSTLDADRVALLRKYTVVGLAHRVVGVGSVGTRALALLLVSGDDALILQAKQATRSVLEQVLEPSAFAHHGQRVVVGQRVMQAADDPLLGWATGRASGETHYYLRQLRDMKGSVETAELGPEALRAYLHLCGAALARAHARSADCTRIDANIGSGKAFDAAIADYALAYRQIVDEDFVRFTASIKGGA